MTKAHSVVYAQVARIFPFAIASVMNPSCMTFRYAAVSPHTVSYLVHGGQ